MWVKVDDRLVEHKKILRAGRRIGGDHGGLAALGMYLAGLSYANVRLSDGFLPTDDVAEFDLSQDPLKAADAMVEAGLWEAVEGGFLIHDYHDYNPHADEVRAKRHADKTRKANERRSKLGLQPLSLDVPTPAVSVARPRGQRPCPAGQASDADSESSPRPAGQRPRPKPVHSDNALVQLDKASVQPESASVLSARARAGTSAGVGPRGCVPSRPVPSYKNQDKEQGAPPPALPQAVDDAPAAPKVAEPPADLSELADPPAPPDEPTPATPPTPPPAPGAMKPLRDAAPVVYPIVEAVIRHMLAEGQAFESDADLVEEAKARCAKHGIAYNSTVIHKAIDSLRYKARATTRTA